MNYINKQRKAKLEHWYICHKLGIKLNDWVNIRQGKRSLVGTKLDDFNKLVDLKQKEWINQREELNKINKWYAFNNKQDILNLIEDFNVMQKEIANDIGCNNSVLSLTIKKPTYSNNIRCLLYYYLNNDGNRRFKVKKNTKKPVKVKLGLSKKTLSKLNKVLTDDVVKPVELIPTPPIDENIYKPFDNITQVKVVEPKVEDMNDPIIAMNGNGINVMKPVTIEEAVNIKKLTYEDNSIESLKKELERYKFLIDEIIRLRQGNKDENNSNT